MLLFLSLFKDSTATGPGHWTSGGCDSAWLLRLYACFPLSYNLFPCLTFAEWSFLWHKRSQMRGVELMWVIPGLPSRSRLMQRGGAYKLLSPGGVREKIFYVLQKIFGHGKFWHGGGMRTTRVHFVSYLRQMRSCGGRYSSYVLSRVVRLTIETNTLTGICLSTDLPITFSHHLLSRRDHHFFPSLCLLPRKL